MNRAIAKRFWLLIGLVWIVSISCWPLSPADPFQIASTESREKYDIEQATQEAILIMTLQNNPTPTFSPSPPPAQLATNTVSIPEAGTTTPTLSPTPPEPAYFTEGFDFDNPAFSTFVLAGIDGGPEMVFVNDSTTTFDINTPATSAFVTYDPWLYADVRITLAAKNRGSNSQQVSLVCRKSADGWFEFATNGNGTYTVQAYAAASATFTTISSGDAPAFLAGRNTNVYAAGCVEDTLSLAINDTPVGEWPIPEEYLFMDEGMVGFGVASFADPTVLMKIEWFEIAAP